MLVAGFIGGALWGAIPAGLKTRFSVNETLSSLMMTYVAIHLLNYLVTGPWKDPSGYSFPQTALITYDQTMPALVPGTGVHLGVLLTLIIALVMWLVMTRSVFGFQIRVVGSAPDAARHGGFSQKQTVWLVFLLSGGLAGLAGIFEVTGPVPADVAGLSAELRLYRYHRCLPWSAESHRGDRPPESCWPSPMWAATWRKARCSCPMPARVFSRAMMLFFLLASDILIRYRVRMVAAPAPLAAAQPARRAA